MRTVCVMIALLLCTLSAAMCLRANTVQLDVSVTSSQPPHLLVVVEHAVSLDFGEVRDPTVILSPGEPPERRNPALLFRARSLWADLTTLWQLWSEDLPPGVNLTQAELTQHPVTVRWWNAYHPFTHVRWGSGVGVGGLRVRPDENCVEFQDATGRHDIPWTNSTFQVRMIVVSLLFAAMLGGALWCLFDLVWCLTRTRTLHLRTLPVRWLLNEWPWDVALVFVLGVVWIGYVRYGVYHNTYGFGDEVNYLVQARILAAGHVALWPPTHPEFFTVDWMTMSGADGGIWGFHAIGWPLLLVPGVWAGDPGLIPPLVGGGVLMVLWLIAYRLVPSRVFAWLAVMIMASSQYVITLLASFMAHGAALLCVELATLGLVLCWQRPFVPHVRDTSQRGLYLCAVGFGLAFLMRPISAVLLLPFPALCILYLLYRRRVRLRVVLSAVCLGALIASIEGWRTYASCGHFTLGYWARGPEMGQTLAERWARGWAWRWQTLYQNVRYYHTRIFGLGWLGNLALASVPVWGIGSPGRWVIGMAYLAIVLFTGCHSFLHFYGWGWEPRLLFEFSHLTILLTAYGVWLLAHATAVRRSWVAIIGAAAVAAGFCAWNFAYDLPDRFTNEYTHYNRTSSFVRDELRRQDIHHALIFHADMTRDFAAHYGDNAITTGPHGEMEMTGDIIHAIDLGAEHNTILMAEYPTYRVFYADDRTLREAPNLYHEVSILRAAILQLQEHVAVDVAVGLPVQHVDTQFLTPGITFFTDETFATTTLLHCRSSQPLLVVLFGSMQRYDTVLRQEYPHIRDIPVSDPGTALYLNVDRSEHNAPLQRRWTISNQGELTERWVPHTTDLPPREDANPVRLPRMAIRRISSFRAPTLGDDPQADVMLDADPNTRWASGAPQHGGEWVRLDFAAPVDVTRLTLAVPGLDKDMPVQLSIFSADDSLLFEKLVTTTTLPPLTAEIPLPPRRTCALFLLQTGRSPSWYWSVGDLAVWGAPVDGGSCP